jgi:hypothetical protein
MCSFQEKMLSRDIIRLLVKRNPEIANTLLPTNRTIHRWIVTDDVLMKELEEHYHQRMQTEVDTQTARLFHIVLNGRQIKNVHLTEGYRNERQYQITFQTGTSHTGSIKKLKVDLTNPQSRDAYRRICDIYRRFRSLKTSDKTIADVCMGIQWVCRADAKAAFSWRRFFTMFLFFEISAMLSASFINKWGRGGMLSSFCVVAAVCYILCERGII